VKLDVWRDGKARSITATLRGDSKDQTLGKESEEETKDLRGSLAGLPGIRVVPSTEALLEKSGLPQDLKGLWVTEVEAAAAMHGLQEGDLILEVNRKAVTTVSEMKKAVQDSRETTLLTVRRKEGTIFVGVPKD
jgi:S1-C subfamily serine protease